MKIDKLYFKWKRSLNTNKFKLDKYISESEIEKELKRNDDSFILKSNPNIWLKIDNQSKIKSMFFAKDSSIGNFEINWKFIAKVKEELESKLEICEKDYSGDKLILHFGDSFLHAASLVRQMNENNTSD